MGRGAPELTSAQARLPVVPAERMHAANVCSTRAAGNGWQFVFMIAEMQVFS
eukprot:COSAG06_NODE_2972_length_6011_cov_2.740528_3_plen_52_part_00